MVTPRKYTASKFVSQVKLRWKKLYIIQLVIGTKKMTFDAFHVSHT